MSKTDSTEPEGPLEIAIFGDLTERENDIADKLLSVPLGSDCTLYFDSPGGSSYCALAIMTLILARRLNCTGVVAGECSSAALWPFAACRRRIVTPLSVMLFHPMKWQSEEHVLIAEAAEWARHFGEMERQMDVLLAQLFEAPLEKLTPWLHPGRYITGPELAAAGLAELCPLAQLAELHERPPAAKKPRRK